MGQGKRLSSEIIEGIVKVIGTKSNKEIAVDFNVSEAVVCRVKKNIYYKRNLRRKNKTVEDGIFDVTNGGAKDFNWIA